MRAIVTVLGLDRPGIIAQVSGVLFSANINILDISQTVLRDKFFAMTMLVDLSGSTLPFDGLKQKLDECAKELQMDIRFQREELFDSMYKV